jgi:hypothetical protein
MNNLPIEILERIYIHSAVAERTSSYTSTVKGQAVRKIKLLPAASRLALVSRVFKEISQEKCIQAKILIGKFIVVVPDSNSSVRSKQIQELFFDPSITSAVASIVFTIVMAWKEYRPALDEIYLEFASTYNHPELVRHYHEKIRSETTSKIKLYSVALIQCSMCRNDPVARVLLEYGADIHFDSDSAIW